MIRPARTIAALAAALLTAATLTLTASPAHARDESPMSTSEAGRYYLKVTCDQNKAQRRFGDDVFGADNYITVREAQRRLRDVRPAADRYADGLQRWASRLYNPPGDWPDSVSRVVNKLAGIVTREVGIRQDQAGARSGQGWVDSNRRANHLPYNNLSGRIRARLDLPAPGKGC